MDEGVGAAVDLGIVTTKKTAARAAPRARLTTSPTPLSPANQHVLDRTTQACHDDAAIGAALRRLSWHRIAQLKASANSQRLLLMKIKGIRGCPHWVHAGTDGGHTFHMMWRCSAAQAMWTILRCFWQCLGLWRQDTPASASSFLLAVFSVRLPVTPVGATPFVAQPQHAANPNDLHDLMQQVCARQVLACFQTIWHWRQGVADEDAPWTHAAASSALRSKLLSSLLSTAVSIDPARSDARGSRHLLTACRRYSPSPRVPPPSPPSSRNEFVLFFDGDSRGNPGPGGAGAVTIRTDRLHTAAQIEWSAANSLASPTTTNNQAEYHGLITGLAAAARNKWRPLEVVGDSLLIVRQLADYHPPKNDKLPTLYREARSLADSTGVERWHHHLRAYDKMADAAANVAMDGRRSIQSKHPPPRPEWAGLDQLLAGDFLHWQSAE